MQKEYTTEQGKGMGAETVQAKGLRLYRSGSVKHLHGDKYLVTGDNGTYKVDNLEDTCECPARVLCSHRYAVEVFAAKQRTEALRQLAAKREEAKRRGAYRPDTSQNSAIEAALDRMAL